MQKIRKRRRARIARSPRVAAPAVREEFVPDFGVFSAVEERLLQARLDAVRAAVAHRGEKGRSLEAEVITLLRSFLPHEYGLSTGFVAYRTEGGIRLSKQLDIIIYDALRYGPLMRLGACDVFPLEAAYAYIEVKAAIQSTSDDAKAFPENSIEDLLATNAEIRKMRRRGFYVPVPDSVAETYLWEDEKQTLSIRGYVVAFEAAGDVAKNPAAMAARMATVSARNGGHIHGLLVAGQAFYSNIAGEPGIVYTTEHSLSVFRWSLLQALTRFTRFPENWAPALGLYGPQTKFLRANPTTS